MQTTESSFDLGVPETVWVLVTIWPSGKKYKDTYFPLKDGRMPARLRHSLERLERKHQEGVESGDYRYMFDDPEKRNYKLHVLHPKYNPNWPTLF